MSEFIEGGAKPIVENPDMVKADDPETESTESKDSGPETETTPDISDAVDNNRETPSGNEGVENVEKFNSELSELNKEVEEVTREERLLASDLHSQFGDLARATNEQDHGHEIGYAQVGELRRTYLLPMADSAKTWNEETETSQKRLEEHFAETKSGLSQDLSAGPDSKISEGVRDKFAQTTRELESHKERYDVTSTNLRESLTHNEDQARIHMTRLNLRFEGTDFSQDASLRYAKQSEGIKDEAFVRLQALDKRWEEVTQRQKQLEAKLR